MFNDCDCVHCLFLQYLMIVTEFIVYFVIFNDGGCVIVYFYNV